MENLGGTGAIYGRGRLRAESPRPESWMEAVAVLPGPMLGELAHDARNMITALELYCDLIEEPGVLAAPWRHYGSELRLVAAGSRRLVEKLEALDMQDLPDLAGSSRPAGRAYRDSAARGRPEAMRPMSLLVAEPISNLAAELEAKRNLLTALSGPGIPLTLDIHGSALPVKLIREDLTRVLVNLVQNATDATPPGGRIAVGLDEFHAGAGDAAWLVLTIEDTGPGILPAALDRIFESGFSMPSGSMQSGLIQTGPIQSGPMRSGNGIGNGAWPAHHRGLGLSITRGIVEAAGGRIHAANRAQGGARFEIELPVRAR
jgi:signal transduction histidine kinase